jgi:response regulator RpfG family c-di-GMP phosphodiesterase
MAEKILFVDDEENILLAFKRQLRKRFDIETTNSGRDAIYLIQNETFSVIVSDLRMPVMDGIQFLTHAKEISPDSVRLLLTGHADLNTAINAINQGDIFRFLTKPCSSEILSDSLEAALEQYRLITAERDLLEKTLSKTVELMTDMLGLSNPFAYGRAIRLKRIVKEISANMHLHNAWQFELAAMLSHIGCVALPENLLEKVYSGKPLKKNEASMYNSHPIIGHRLLMNIPRLEFIAEMVRDQQRDFSASTDKPYSHHTQDIELGAQILKVATDYDKLTHYGISHDKTVLNLLRKTRIYDSEIVEALGEKEIFDDNMEIKSVDVRSAKQGMILNEDVYSKDGQILMSMGMQLSNATLETLKLTSNTIGVVEPFRVLVNK